MKRQKWQSQNVKLRPEGPKAFLGWGECEGEVPTGCPRGPVRPCGRKHTRVSGHTEAGQAQRWGPRWGSCWDRHKRMES